MSGWRRPAAQTVTVAMPDPPIEAGPFRVLPRTDGKLVVIDERRRWDDLGVYVAASRPEAERAVAGLLAKDRA